ncbi:MAG: branched-chain amino acid ABC transporter permease [Candidatus Rokubacteria bacterium]|nr:branched-chain amino acid ABC transporter permease [Candidatus Rokubacteria bacterium]
MTTVRVALAFGLLAGFATLPLWAEAYYLSFLLFLFISMALAQSYDLVGGYMGYLNLGHAAFFGIGAYTFGILVHEGLPVAVGFAAAVVVPMAFAGGISYPFFRLRGAYFALATFGLVVLLELLAFNFSGLTGGSIGLTVMTGYQLVPAYYMSLALVAGMACATILITRSRIGLALVSIREDEEVAEVFGIHALFFKALTLMGSAGVAGLAGAVYCWYLTYLIPPTVFGLETALGPIVMAMLGGSGTVVGPILGAFIVDLFREILRLKTQYLALTTYGILLILVGLFMPGGIARSALWRRLVARVR